MNWGSWLDEYDREARLVPALLALLPLVLVAVGFGIERNPIVVTVVAVLLSFGMPVLVAKRVADRGRAVEADLFAKWGAPPTTLKLVPSTDGHIGEILRQRRNRLEQASGVTLPASTSLTEADAETYHAAVRWLIEHTRDHAEFPVVWSELKSYGFERNMHGLRALALACSATAALVLAAGALAAALGAGPSVGAYAALTGASVLLTLGWSCLPSERRVRAAADRYAERLLDALVLIP